MATRPDADPLKPVRDRGVTDRSFLADCSPRVGELFAYWDARRGDRTMPRRADIDPVDFPGHLPRIMLVDVDGEDANGRVLLRYRVVGTKEVQLRGQDPTGLHVRDACFGPSLDSVLACYEFVCASRTFLFDRLRYQMQDGRFVEDRALFLPLSEDGTTVTQILVYVERQVEDRG